MESASFMWGGERLRAGLLKPCPLIVFSLSGMNGAF